MSKKKLALKDLDIKSFVTGMSPSDQARLEGGDSCECNSGGPCLWTLYGCDAITMMCSYDNGACTGECCAA